jgi:intracellular septation protein
MNALFEFLPLVVFIIAFKLKGIYIATAALMIITCLQSIVIYIKHKKLSPMQWVTLLIVLIFGGATLFFHDERFIKIKPTALYWLFAVALEVSWRYYKTNLAEKFFKSALEKSNIYINKQEIWQKVHHFSAAFFWFLGLLNLIIAYNATMDTWVTMKTFVFPILTFVSLGVLLIWLFKHNEAPKNQQHIE